MKQVPQVWFEKFIIVIASIGFQSSDYDSPLFVITTSQGHSLLSFHVDDMINIDDYVDEIYGLKLQLSKKVR